MANPLAPISPNSWTPAHARHLLNRAGFGLPLPDVARLAAMTPEAAVDRFVDFERVPEPVPDPDFLPKPFDFAAMRKKLQGMTEEEKQKLRQQEMVEQRQVVAQMQDWWFDRMLTTLRPLQAKLELFWHGHFATSAQKVKLARHNWRIWRVFHRHAAGNFRELVRAVGKSPAMLEYLDNRQNRKGHPNENWARELMELFTMGRGNYTEQDIREAARAFTGWQFLGERFWFNERAHDDGVKTVLGHRGNFDGDDVVDIVVENPATATFIARKLWEFFACENPEAEIVEGLARVFTEAEFELKPVLKTIFLSEAFYSERAIASQIKSPVQLALGLIDALDIPLGEESGRFLRMILTGLGQELFYPPNVKGWPGNRAWIDTNTLLLRCNAAGILVNGLDPDDLADGGGGGGAGPRKLGLPRRVRTPFDAARFSKKLAGSKTVGEAVDRAATILLARPPAPDQRTLLALAVGGGEKEAFKGARDGEVRALVHLITSMAEFQLC